MDTVWKEIFSGYTDTTHLLRVLVRLVVAVLLGGLLGIERKWEGKAAGLRTHMLVSLGAAMFMLVPLEGGMDIRDLSRVIQGVAAGIGFLGAGTIIQLRDEHRIEGLTSAASIWLTAAAGMSVGAGWIWPAVMGVILAWLILLLHILEHWVRGKMGG